jgi:hypothetical protein
VADNIPNTATVPAAAPAAFDIEKPACFYLGREYDLATKTVRPDGYVMYDARDLTTHGVVVGMTGSGKTGMAISLLEEAAIDGIPSIIIDPKGDLTNLLLQFPDLDPRKFEQWLNPEDAQQKGISPVEYAKQLAERWRHGLEETAQTPERISRLAAAADYRIYTPGSEAGLALSILGTFAAPKSAMPREALTHKIDATTIALLGLTGIASDPVQSREHVLIAQLLYHAWTNKQDLDLAGLIVQIQNPPIRTVGAYNLETFFPAKERIKFASTLNNVLASPSFLTWTTGEPLDLSSMLYRAGKAQQLIFYIAHLDDTQRMFFTTLLLEELLSWTRKQSGTSNLRALLYFDEVFGYLPPHPANPPSKQPLLTLLKQARAFGVGVLLATQNPVDLDYKALSNAGTWFVGKLQTERDKNRLLEGLETVAAEQGTMTDRGYLEKVIASLGNRIFLMHDVHRPKPLLFQSRWALSFLRGPMTRDQVTELMKPLKESPPLAIPLCTSCHAELGPDVVDLCPKCGQDPFARASFRVADQAFRENLRNGAPPPLRMATPPVPIAQPAKGDSSLSYQPPVLPPDVNQFYLSLASEQRTPAGAEVEYQPFVLGFAEVTFLIDKRTGAEFKQPFNLLARPAAPGHPLVWPEAERVSAELVGKPISNARWANVSESLDTGRKLKALEKAFAEFLYSTQKLSLFQNRPLGLISAPGESEETFRKRCRDAAEVQMREAVEMNRVEFKPRFEALDAELPRDQPEPAKGGSILGWLNPFGSSKPSMPDDPKLEKQVRKLTGDYESKRDKIVEKWKRSADDIKPLQIKPRKTDVRVTHFGLGWAPCFRRVGPGDRVELVPAYH